MKGRFFILVAALVFFPCLRSFGAPFQNLDFEQGSIHSPPANYVPTSIFNPISAAFALPFWTPIEDTTVVTAIWSGGALDETSISLVSSANPSPIDGNYSVNLYAFADAPPGLYKTASISQTGDVPANAQSIQFQMRSYTPTIIQATPTVTLNNTVINLVPLATSGYVVTMAGDISAFAGSTAQLMIKAAGTSGMGNFYVENYFDVDDISFSPNPVPEPSTALLAVTGFAAVLLSFHAKKKAISAQ